MISDSLPLKQLLAGKPLTVAEIARYAMQVGGALRRMHSEGRSHGALTPELILVGESTARLLPAGPMASEDLTPYTAPEVVREETVDSRTDIFAFGAVVYEMATGRRVFVEEDPERLREEILTKVFSPVGHDGLDQILKRCLAKDPAERWHSIQKVQMELRLVALTEKQSETTTVGELTRVVNEALQNVQAQYSNVEIFLAASEHRADQFAQSVAETARDTKREIAELHVQLGGELSILSQVSKEQAAEIEAVRSSTKWTEDYVERVVETLEGMSGRQSVELRPVMALAS